MGIFSFISNIFGPVASLVDDLTLSDEEKLRIEAAIKKAQIDASIEALQLDGKIAEAQASIIVAEAKGESPIQRLWRPVTMLVFTGLIVARWFGFSAEGISPELELQLFEIIKLGLGGYVVGRSGEKMMKEFRAK